MADVKKHVKNLFKREIDVTSASLFLLNLLRYFIFIIIVRSARVIMKISKFLNGNIRLFLVF